MRNNLWGAGTGILTQRSQGCELAVEGCTPEPSNFPQDPVYYASILFFNGDGFPSLSPGCEGE